MESGQVKTGEDKDDTFTKMLQEVVRVTPPIAFGIAAEYPSAVNLVKAFRRYGPLVLEDLQVRKTVGSPPWFYSLSVSRVRWAVLSKLTPLAEISKPQRSSHGPQNRPCD